MPIAVFQNTETSKSVSTESAVMHSAGGIRADDRVQHFARTVLDQNCEIDLPKYTLSASKPRNERFSKGTECVCNRSS